MMNRLANRSRLAVALFAIALVAGACSGDTGSTEPDGSNDQTNADNGSSAEADSGDTGDAAADGETDAAADAADNPEDDPVEEPVEEEPEPEPEPEPVPVSLALSPDSIGSTDPLETVNHLAAVTLLAADDGVEVQFPALENGGLRVEVVDEAQGMTVFCDMYMQEGELIAQCTGYEPTTGLFLDGVPSRIVDDSVGYTYVVPLTSDGSVVSLTFGGTTYSAPSATFSDAPGFVQINPDGSLSAPVVRSIGIATAAELQTALG